ncbi:MAG: phosphoribosyl-AMP cyclohydrolase [Planctomycetes bacterium]|nr:phosphoribosyl-AMP cyclohydrolase [Planctomycetota bacterium]
MLTVSQSFGNPKLNPGERKTPLSTLPDFSDADRLLPAVAQDAATGQVLMLAYMNRAAWEQTLATGEATYFSRSRGQLWKKGEQSGHVQRVREIYVDCDGDTILLKVEQVGGAACHKGYESCFFRQWDGKEFQSVGRRVFDPQQVYDAGK